jgi:GH43 family beta-xylosidase
MKPPAPLIPQRADPHILKHSDGYYYFTGSIPAYDAIELRRAKTIAGLSTAPAVSVWRKPAQGPLSELIWAPEIHYYDGQWLIYFAAAPTRAIKDGLFQHRMYAITAIGENPLEADWRPAGPIHGAFDTFCLDATAFNHRGHRYFLWAQKDPNIVGNSNLYLARMDSPTHLATRATMISRPEFPWETRGFSVNEGPAVLIRHGKVFVTFSASATDENYCIGLLYAPENADLLDSASWTKLRDPVLCSAPEQKMFGPGHNSFTVSEDGYRDLLVYHARNYTEIEGDPLWDPNRHTYVSPVTWSDAGFPIFRHPVA